MQDVLAFASLGWALYTLVRVLFAEQLYRAFTILRNEPYHHEG